jgi:Ca2+-binding RTX toxin-like protein
MATYLYGAKQSSYFIADPVRTSDEGRVTFKAADLVVGTPGPEVLQGHEGGIFDDQIWGGEGNDTMLGGGGNDTIKPGYPSKDHVWNWGKDEAHGGPGADTLDFSTNTNEVVLYGDEDNDILKGGSSGDKLYGGDEHDQLFGNLGNDRLEGGEGSDNLFGSWGADLLFGQAGFDWLEGGGDSDVLDGGADKDWLTGDWGNDIFRFGLSNGVSDTNVDKPDELMDFWKDEDHVDLPISGTASNYTELFINYGAGYDNAKPLADTWIGSDTGFRYMFITDQVDGFLFADFDGSGTVDSGIVMKGMNNLADFDHLHII